VFRDRTTHSKEGTTHGAQGTTDSAEREADRDGSGARTAAPDVEARAALIQALIPVALDRVREEL
jgi:hypothetical protein